MVKNTPTVKTGRKPKVTTKMATDEAATRSQHGGPRENSGPKVKYKRIDVAERLEFLNFGLIEEYMKLYDEAIVEKDRKLRKEILDKLIDFSASRFGPTTPDADGTDPMEKFQQLLTELATKIPRPPEPQGSTPKDDE